MTAPTLEELKDADHRHDLMIAQLKAEFGAHTTMLERTIEVVERHDEMLTELRTAYGKVATSKDISDLSDKIDKKFNQQLTDAYNSIPGKYAAWFAGGMFILATVGLAMKLSGHGQ